MSEPQHIREILQRERHKSRVMEATADFFLAKKQRAKKHRVKVDQGKLW